MSIDQPEQFEKMKEIGAIVANCLEYLKSKAKPGITTLELDLLAAKFLEQHGAQSAPMSVYKFPGHVCISLEKEAAHGIPNERVLKAGDLINIDVSAHKEGLFADNGESFVVAGKTSEDSELLLKNKLCHAVRIALDEGIQAAKAGGKIANIGRAVERVANKHQLTIIENLGGHGVGLSLHEKPEFIAGHYNKRDKRIFTENLVVAIEPFLSHGARWVEEGSDGWTLYHPDFYSAQKEHTIMITKDRPFIFTRPTKNYA